MIAAAKLGHHCQHPVQVDPVRQRPVCGCLYDRPVRHRIGERYPELDHVGARLDDAVEELDRLVGSRIARHDIGHEGGAIAPAQILEKLLNATHERNSAVNLQSDPVDPGDGFDVLVPATGQIHHQELLG